MSESVYKDIERLGTSKESREKAATGAVEQAAKRCAICASPRSSGSICNWTPRARSKPTVPSSTYPSSSKGREAENCRVGKAKACPPCIKKRKVGTALRAFAHPHMRPFESSVARRLGCNFLVFGERRRAEPCVAQRAAAVGRSGTGFRRFMQHLTASPHIRSDRHGPYPHSACLRRGSHEDETHLRSGLFVAQGWHGHHPSRADRGRCRDADALVEAFTSLRP